MGTGHDYSDPISAHNILADAWVGTSEIHEKQVDEQETQNIIEPVDPVGNNKNTRDC